MSRSKTYITEAYSNVDFHTDNFNNIAYLQHIWTICFCNWLTIWKKNILSQQLITIHLPEKQ